MSLRRTKGERNILKEKEILEFLRRREASGRYASALVGQRYYGAKHDILSYRMFYYDSSGALREDTVRSNMKIPHPFFTELVDQTAQYMLSGRGRYVRSDLPGLQEALDGYFDEDFKTQLCALLTGAMVKGCEYLYAYAASDGRLRFERADSLGVCEVPASESPDGRAYVIYRYEDTDELSPERVCRVQLWDDRETRFFVLDGEKGLVPDKSVPRDPRPHVLYEGGDGATKQGVSLGFIPFFRLDNNDERSSSLGPVKALIDDYDLMSCGLSNNIADFDYPLHVVKGFKGDSLDELRENLKTKKLIGVGEGGDVEIRTVDVPYQARLAKLREDEKNIYRFGMGFNSAMVGDGNLTNVIIKSRFALLDLKCNKLEDRLKALLRRVLVPVLEQINARLGTAYSEKDVWFDFERRMIVNETDRASAALSGAKCRQTDVATLVGLRETLGAETVLALVCDALDIDKRIISEEKE